MRKLIQKGINMAIAQGIIKPVAPISKPKTVNTIAPKSKPAKYASIGKSQMRTGRSGTVVTSGGLLINNKTTIKKKKLLGS
jgi:hypothetical protein